MLACLSSQEEKGGRFIKEVSGDGEGILVQTWRLPVRG